MALMASTRREADTQSFPLFVYLLTPLLALGLQSFVPLVFSHFSILDLPLLVVIYFASTLRTPIAATIGGAILGLAQDALTHQPLGVFGIAKACIGYTAASLGVRIDTESPVSRLVFTFLFVFLNDAIDWVLVRHLLARPMPWEWLHELIRGVVNTFVALIFFALLDRLKQRE
ncbi:MAG TPA: rod shape-determining protein MreD [Acidobacteriaceae bacterium]|nr:rod shape-determining protein MreD [Acidobacteriaceae bacterium]